MNRKHILAVAVVATALFVGLVLYRDQLRRQESGKQTVTTSTTVLTDEVAPIDDGNGVLYFPATGDTLRRSLSKFYELSPGRHCDLQGFTERAVSGAYATHAMTTGFILHCHDVAVEAQAITIP